MAKLMDNPAGKRADHAQRAFFFREAFTTELLALRILLYLRALVFGLTLCFGAKFQLDLPAAI
jgi:hypothetical protein